MKRVSMVAVILFVIGVWLMTSTEFCQAGAPEEIKIGVTAPLTGPAAEAGIALKQGIILAVEEWNGKGGVYVKEAGKKLPIKVWIEDSQSKPEVGVSVGEKLISSNKVHILLGDAFASSVTMAVMELAPKYGIPIMSIEPVSTEIAKKVVDNPKRYWSYWKGDFNSDDYAATIFNTYSYLIKEGLFKPKNKSVAFIVEDTDYGRSNAEKASELFSGIGWKTLTIEAVALGYTDFYPQLTKIKQSNPDVVVTVFTSLASGVAFIKQFHELGLKSSPFAIYYPLRPEFIPQAGKAADFLMWAPLMVDTENNPEQKEFGEKIKKRWNVTLTMDHGSGYDGANNAIKSIEKAESLEPKAIVQELSKLDSKGFLGRYVFNQENHTVRAGEEFLPVPTCQIQNGQRKIIWPASRANGNYQTPPWLD